MQTLLGFICHQGALSTAYTYIVENNSPERSGDFSFTPILMF